MLQFDLFGGSVALANVVAGFRAALERPELELTLATPLEEIEGWDSMWHVAVMVELESRFGLTLEPHEIEAVQTVGDVVRLIGARRALDAA
ncbi:MAG: acyl carrier protein [Acetobacteraceae bacterium]|nr:acyl carrier protein [Acetobacteraceae bacterium]